LGEAAVHRVKGRLEKNPSGFFDWSAVHGAKKSDDFFSSSGF